MADVSIVDVKPMAICAVRVRTDIATWPSQFGRSLDKIWAAAKAGQIGKPGKNVMVYRNRADGLTDIECGAEAPFAFQPVGEIILTATPSGRVVTVAHFGDYRRLGDSHAAARTWAKANGHALQPVCWEIYDHWRDDPETVRTDIFHLLQA